MTIQVPTHWSTFKELYRSLDTAETLAQAERVLREAKAQIGGGALKRSQLQQLRDLFHWRMENGLKASGER